jgi:Phosphotransferase enzyme family
MADGGDGVAPAVVDDPVDLTPDWLTAALRSGGHEVTVRSVSHERIGTGQIGASYRLQLGFVERNPSVPATIVAKLAAGSAEARERVGEGYHKEVRFYQDLAPLVAVNIPKCWYAAISDNMHSFTLLLEDLAPSLPGKQVDGCTPDQAADAVANLAGLHAPLWRSPVLEQHAKWLRPLDEAAGNFLGELMVGATDQFVHLYDAALGPANAATLRASAALIGRWSSAGADIMSITHGDYRLDNLMFPPAGPGVAAVDWQTTSAGPPLRDLAYFLGNSLAPELRRDHEKDLVTVYLAALEGHGVNHPAERAFDDYRLGMLQGPLITVLGRIYATAEPSAAADEMFLTMATRSCAAIRDLDSLELLKN